jgi:hypothetical protein
MRTRKPDVEAPRGRGGESSAKRGAVGAATLAGSRESKRIAAVVLEVLSGLRSTGDGAAALGIGPSRYYQLELRALQGMIEALEPRARGPKQRPETAIATLERDRERLLRELQRSQALVRLAQRSIGLTPPVPPKQRGRPGKRRRAMTPRSVHVVRALQEASGATTEPVGGGPETTGADRGVA